MPVPPIKLAVLHYQAAGDPVDPVVHQVEEALKGLGHSVGLLAVSNHVQDLLQNIQSAECDLVFNLCETFADDYRLEVNVAALMELARVNFTGSGTAGLLLAQDKILTKQLLEYHEIPTPDFATFDGETFESKGTLTFPLIVKPARSDASIGIGKKSVVSSWDELTSRVREIRRLLRDEALAEEFIDGREVYVGVIGPNQRPEILPIVELDFGHKWDKSRPTIADRDAKFGPETDGSPRLVIARDLAPELRARIERAALLAYRALKVRDYARIDLRISATGEPYILEVNPNPYLDDKSELALAAREKGIGYPQLIDRILDSAAQRYGLPRRAPVERPSVSVPAPPVAATPEAGEPTVAPPPATPLAEAK